MCLAAQSYTVYQVYMFVSYDIMHACNTRNGRRDEEKKNKRVPHSTRVRWYMEGGSGSVGVVVFGAINIVNRYACALVHGRCAHLVNLHLHGKKRALRIQRPRRTPARTCRHIY